MSRGSCLTGLALPPSFDVLSGVFLPDLCHARLLGRLALALEQSSNNAASPVDFGAGGELAGETAERFARAGCARVALVGCEHDRRAMTILAEELRNRNIESLIPAADQDALRVVCEWLRADGTPGGVPVTRLDAKASEAPMLILGAEDDLPERWQGVWRESASGLHRRKGAGRTMALPDSIHTIRFLNPGKQLGRLDVAEMIAVRLPGPAPEAGGLDALCDWIRPLAERAGPERIRLVPEVEPGLVPPRARGAPWAERLRLLDPSWVAASHRIVEESWPHLFPQWHVVLGFLRLSIAPLEEIYAGNALIDRNPELMVNILP